MHSTLHLRQRARQRWAAFSAGLRAEAQKLAGEGGIFTTLTVSGMALAGVSLRLLWATPHPLINLVLTSAAFCLVLMGLLAEDDPVVRRRVSRSVSAAAAFLDIAPLKVVVLIVGVLLSLAAWSASGGEALTHVPGAGVLWLLSVGLTVVALWKPSVHATDEPADRLHIVVWAVILSVTIVLRVVSLNDAPAAVTGDEGSVGLVAREFASGLRNNLFQIAWHSFPSLYFGMVSLSQHLLGHSLEAIRLTSALGGALSIAAAYWAAEKLFGRTHALLSAAFLAVYNVHLLFSRIATASVWDGLFFSVALGGLWMGASRGDRAGFVLAGLAAGLAQYFHPISRLLLVTALIWVALFRARIRRENRLPGMAAGGLVALVTFLPLALYYSTRPSEYFAPFRGIAVMGDTPLLSAIIGAPGTTLPVLAAQLRASLLGIGLEPLGGVYAPGTPLLLPIPAALFVVGLLIAVLRRHDARFAALMVSLIAPLIVGAVSIEAPNVELLLAIAPAAAMLIATPLVEGLDHVRSLGWKAHRAASVLLALVMLLIGSFELRQVMGTRPPFAGYAGPASSLAWQMGKFLAGIPEGTPVYLFGQPSVAFAWEPGLAYLAADFETYDVAWPLEAGQQLPSPGTRAVLFFTEEQMGALGEVSRLYPGARVFIHTASTNEPRFASMVLEP